MNSPGSRPRWPGRAPVRAADTRRHPPVSRLNGGHYTRQSPGLATLARHLADQGRAGRSGTDLLLHQLWRAAGPVCPATSTAVILTAIAATPLLALGILDLAGNPDDDHAVLVVFAGVIRVG